MIINIFKMAKVLNLVFSTLLFFSLYAGCHAHGTEQQDATEAKKPESNPVDFTIFPNLEKVTTAPRCGGVIRSVQATIDYKLFDPAEDNERCVWIVAAPNASAYDVEIFSRINSTQRPLTIAGITRRSESISHVYPSGSGRLNRITASILVITFQTGNSSGSVPGFALRATKAADGDVNRSSKYEIIEATNNAVMKHPASTANYVNDELSAFAFPPRNNFASDSVRNVIFQEIRLESCYDFVSVYEFNSTTSSFTNRGKLCQGSNPIPISSNDIILLVFHSDYSIVYGGFYLASYSSSQC